MSSRILTIVASGLFLSLSACSSVHKDMSNSFLKSGSVTLAQSVPSEAPSALIGYLPSVPSGAEFSESGTVTVENEVPAAEGVFAPLIGFFTEKLTRVNFSQSGTVAIDRVVPQ